MPGSSSAGSGDLPALSDAISPVSCCTFCSRFLTCAECALTAEARALSWLTRFTTLHIAVRATSEMLRAPLSTQNLSNAEYSSSESRTPIVRMRGTRTGTGNPEGCYEELRFGMKSSANEPKELFFLCDAIEAGFAPPGPMYEIGHCAATTRCPWLNKSIASTSRHPARPRLAGPQLYWGIKFTIALS